MRSLAQKEKRRKYEQKYREAHKEETQERYKKYKEIHKEELWKYRNAHKERSSIRSHHYAIFKERRPSYKGMKFYDGWNPNKGGSYKAGEDWIIKNLGRYPRGCSLHIIEHEKGFVPGNLEWTYPRKQSNQQMYKIIAQQKHRVKQLEQCVVRLKAAVQELKNEQPDNRGRSRTTT